MNGVGGGVEVPEAELAVWNHGVRFTMICYFVINNGFVHFAQARGQANRSVASRVFWVLAFFDNR